MTTLNKDNRKTECFLRIYYVLGFLIFLYLSQTLQQIFIIMTYLDSIENILMLFFIIITYVDSIENLLMLFSHSFYIH